MDIPLIQPEDQRENAKKEHWNHGVQLLAACSAGYLAIQGFIRFPYMLYTYGGIAFLKYYGLAIMFLGMPLILLEISLGQYMSKGAVGCWDAFPMARGIGVTILWTSAVYSIIFLSISSNPIVYFIYSFYSTMPWTQCNNSWNTDRCHTLNSTNSTDYATYYSLYNGPSAEFFEHHVLQQSKGFFLLEGINWRLATASLVLIMSCYIVLFKGVKVFGKVMCVTSILPYLLLGAMFIRGATLPGALQGFSRFLHPYEPRHDNNELWYGTAQLVLHSSGIGTGLFITLGSYNKIQEHRYTYTFIFGLLLFFIPIVCALSVYFLLANLAYTHGRHPAEFITGGWDLLYTVLPEAISNLEFSHWWTRVFFLMISLFYFNNLLMLIEISCKSFSELVQWKYKYAKEVLYAALMLFQYILGLPLITHAGVYILTFLDNHTNSGIMWTCLLEPTSFLFILGSHMIFNGTQTLRGMSFHVCLYRLRVYFETCFYACAMVISGLCVVYAWDHYEPVHEYYSSIRDMSVLADYGTFLFAFAYMIAPVYLCIIVLKAFIQSFARGNTSKNLFALIKPQGIDNLPVWIRGEDIHHPNVVGPSNENPVIPSTLDATMM